MTVFEKIKSMSIDEFVKWHKESTWRGADPCDTWFSETYCNNCEEVIEDKVYGWCELHGKCKFFQDMDNMPSYEQTIKMWLDSEFAEVENDD